MDTESPKGRLWRVKPNDACGLLSGSTADGRLFLLGEKDLTTACVVFFDPDGNYLGWEEHPLPAVAPPGGGPGPDPLSAFMQRARGEWGWRPGEVRVAPFAVEDADMDIGIAELPWYLQQIRDDPAGQRRSLGDEEFERFQTMLAEWVQRGDCVLTWGGDMHLNQDGDVVFS